MTNSKNRLGEINYNRYGSKMTIIEYNNSRNVIIQFDNGFKTKCRYDHFKEGNIFNPYDKSLYEIGYIGEGEYEVSKNGKHTIQYKYWSWMLWRCYDIESEKKHPTYTDKSVCEEWLCFQSFSKWFDNNYYKIDNETMCLDKDILFKGNKIYSPKTCVFVPERLNGLLIMRQNYRGNLPIGVTVNNNKFIARCCTLKQRVNLGTYNTPEDAFYNGYKPFKENYIKQETERYKDYIPKKLYDALYGYEVNIND